ncbi:MAG: M28 family peptidase [Balneolaceae bacterium]
MKRRHFLSMMGGVPFLPAASYAKTNRVSESARSAEDLVGSYEARSDYIMDLLYEICAFGPRHTGSPAYLQAAHVLKREMERTLPSVELDQYQFEGWEPIGLPEFKIGRQPFEVWPSQGSVGTSPEGITGRMEKEDGNFFLVDSGSGKKLARFLISSYGRAVPSFQRDRSTPPVRNIGIGRQDVPLLEKAAAERSEAWLKTCSRTVPNAHGANVVGQIPGRSRDEILFISHADSVYTTPGAHDNLASVLIMIMLAHAATERDWNHTLTFIAADGEEFGYVGAYNYARGRTSQQTMNRIKYVINMDSLTYGPNLWINSHVEELHEQIRAIHRDLGIDTETIHSDGSGFSMDSLPFEPSGAKSMHVNSRGYDEKTLPLWHRQEDLPHEIPLDCVDIAFRVFSEFLNRVD